MMDIVDSRRSFMRAAWYSINGEACDVLQVGDLPTPEPGPGQVRVKLKVSGVNPSDVKSRRGRPIDSDLIVPHSDGAGLIDKVGQGVSPDRLGERVWVWNGQWRRPMGTAAEYIVLPQDQAVLLPDATDFQAGACLGIPALTALHALELAGDIHRSEEHTSELQSLMRISYAVLCLKIIKSYQEHT